MKGNTIANYDGYLSGMKKSLEDKLFFEKWLSDAEALVDFGCADGTLLAEIHNRYPKLKLSGIDMNELMLKKLKVKCSTVHSDLPKDPNLDVKPSATVLNLSSVLHEVYSYGSKDYIQAFWRTVNEEGYKYVFIRDMLYEDLQPGKDKYQWHRKLYKHGNLQQLSEFERFHGNLLNKKNIVHFLLKYRYVQNWEREVRENYLSLKAADIVNALYEYDCVYCERYAMPFLRDRLKADFDINFNEMTHVKMVFKLREDA